MALKLVDSDTIIVDFSPIMGDKKNTRRGTVKTRGSIVMRNNTGTVDARATVAIRLRKLSEGLTDLEYACALEVGSSVSRRASKAFAEQHLAEVVEMFIYFQRLVPLKDFKAEDGKALGYNLLWKVRSSRQRVEKLSEVFKHSSALRELLVEHPFIQAMMIPAVRGYLNISKSVGTKLICLSEAEAT